MASIKLRARNIYIRMYVCPGACTRLAIIDCCDIFGFDSRNDECKIHYAVLKLSAIRDRNLFYCRAYERWHERCDVIPRRGYMTTREEREGAACVIYARNAKRFLRLSSRDVSDSARYKRRAEIGALAVTFDVEIMEVEGRVQDISLRATRDKDVE